MIIHLPMAKVEAIRAEIGRLLGRIQVRKEPGKAIAWLGLLNQEYINRKLMVAGVGFEPTTFGL